MSVAMTPQLSIAVPEQQTPKLEGGVHSISPIHGLTSQAEAGKRSPISSTLDHMSILAHKF